jgi:LysR family glycine cleavage system transcriptional activator
MDWRRIPSLPALRALEAAARLGSLAAAADALNVTPAAISQHIRTLEREFGPLMRRDGRRLVPTDRGHVLAAGLREGFGRIAATIEELRRELEGAPVSVSLTPGFAANWLMPRLGSFWAAHPEVELALHPSESLEDVPADAFDVSIRYGSGSWSGLRAHWLTDADFSVVAAPRFLADARASGRSPGSGRWIFAPAGREYRNWAEQHGHLTPDAPVSTLDTNDLVLAAVRAGHGLSVQPRALVEQDLRSGALEVLSRNSDPGVGYYLLHSPEPLRASVRAFVDWLPTAA